MASSKGKKITCKECGAKFYDLNKNSPTCPKCKAEQPSSAKLHRPGKKRKSESKSSAKDTDQSSLYTFGLVARAGDSQDGYISPSLKDVKLEKSISKPSGWFVVSLDEENSKSKPVSINLPAAPIEGLKRYLATWRFEGVGPKTAEELTSALDNSVFAFLDGAPGKYQSPSAIDDGLLKSIKETWAANSDSNMLHVFLHELDLRYGVINTIEREIGERIVEVILKEPFSLVTAIPRFTFEDARRIINFLSIDLPAEKLVAAATDYRLLKSERERGHTCGPMDRVVPEVSKLVDMSEDVVRGFLGNLTESFHFETFDDALMVSRKEAFERDQSIIERLGSLKDGDTSKYDDLDFDPKSVKTPDSVSLSDDQIAALSIAVENPVCLITGGPGAGKTTLVVAIVRALKDLDRNVTLCAPTGRAAKRLGETPGLEKFGPTTIHLLLARRKSGRSKPIDTLIVDEASMVDADLMVRLLEALDSTSSLIMIGDADQLPPVGPGQVFKDMLASNVIPTSRLLGNFRQLEASKVVTAAKNIISGEMPVLEDDETVSDFVFRSIDNPKQQNLEIVDLYLNKLPAQYGYDPVTDIQILSPMRKGEVGITELNDVIQKERTQSGELLHRRKIGDRTIQFFANDKVIQTANDYELEVMNGDIGTVVRKTDSGIEADMGGKIVDYDEEKIRNLDLAYAISIHKSQGSEYSSVIIPIAAEHQFMLARNLLYTAVTRGKQRVFCVGNVQALASGIAAEWKDARYTLLKFLLAKVSGEE